jgi:hypothetical protein
MRPSAVRLGPAVNLLPPRLREQVYIWTGWSEALPPRKLRELRAEAVAAWMVERYPPRRYPAVFLGSSNGAVVHLAAALGAPWLPQTLLVPVRWSGVHPDEPRQALAAGVGPARVLLERNPELQLHHMHNPNQDRLMVRRMGYFRVKWRRLPGAYARFLERHLQPGGTVYLVECGLRWPVTRVGERHLFQFGALGGASVEEFLRGSGRVEEYLARYRSHRRGWEPPEPDAEAPEAEWGFEPALLALFAHGVDSVGLASMERWRSLLDRATGRGAFLGVDQRRFPRDFAVFHRYHAELERLEPRYELPPPLAPADLNRLLATLPRR